ncbi:hypothetical protein MASR2M29_08940 [Spirochaetota bacterium]
MDQKEKDPKVKKEKIEACDKAFDQESARLHDKDEPCDNAEH